MYYELFETIEKKNATYHILYSFVIENNLDRDYLELRLVSLKKCNIYRNRISHSFSNPQNIYIGKIENEIVKLYKSINNNVNQNLTLVEEISNIDDLINIQN